MILKTGMVYLRALDVEDTESFYRWGCDDEITQYSLSGYRYPQSRTDVQKWLSQINDDSRTITFGIVLQENHQLIGYAGISSMSTLNRSGEFFILIGEKELWGKGIASLVTRRITEYAFADIGLHRVTLTAFADNPAAVKAYSNAGYRQEGVLRQAGFRHGEFKDKVTMAALATEWCFNSKG